MSTNNAGEAAAVLLAVQRTPLHIELEIKTHRGHCDIFFYENAPEMFDMTQL